MTYSLGRLVVGFCLMLLLGACASQGSRDLLHPNEYKVKKGDTLYSIAWRYNLDHKELARWNAIRPPYTIYPGQRLKMNPVVIADSGPAKPRAAPAPKPRGTGNTTTAARSASQKPPPPKRSAAQPASPQKMGWVWPTDGKVIRGFSSNASGKKGIDISGRPGQPVKATSAGKVVYSGSGLLGYGRLIIINHNKNYLSAYAHNRKLLVKEGEYVRSGQQIAELGSSGTDKPMLHFEIRRDGRPVDPLKYLPKR